MKRTLIGLLLCATGLGLSAQDNSKEIIKQGWNFGPLPVVGWDSDLGFQYGACVDIFNYGDGTNYPSYNYKMNLEASTYTGAPGPVPGALPRHWLAGAVEGGAEYRKWTGFR